MNVHDLIGMSPEPLGIATITKVMPHDFINALGLGFTRLGRRGFSGSAVPTSVGEAFLHERA